MDTSGTESDGEPPPVPPNRRRRATPDYTPTDTSDAESNEEPSPVSPNQKRRSASDYTSLDMPDPDEPPHRTLLLDESHPDFLHEGEEFFLAVPGDSDWEDLLVTYTEFERLAPLVGFSNPFPSS